MSQGGVALLLVKIIAMIILSSPTAAARERKIRRRKAFMTERIIKNYFTIFSCCFIEILCSIDENLCDETRRRQKNVT